MKQIILYFLFVKYGIFLNTKRLVIFSQSCVYIFVEGDLVKFKNNIPIWISGISNSDKIWKL